MDSILLSYLPQDRQRALARGHDLPELTQGAALFADISGFTPRTETLTSRLGSRRGIEELTRQINAIYDALIAEVDRVGGSVIGFAGDGITCWFADDPRSNGQTAYSEAPPELVEGPAEGFTRPTDRLSAALRATVCARAMQAVMAAFTGLTLKIAVASGPARRLVVGDPDIQLIDTLAGATIGRLATAEHLAQQGDILLDETTIQSLGTHVTIREWRVDEGTGDRFAVLTGLQIADFRLQIELDRAEAQSAIYNLQSEMVRPWLLPAVYSHEQNGHGAFLTELRPAVALFLHFDGIDYDNDRQAQFKLDSYIQHVQRVLATYDSYMLQLTIGDKGSYLYACFGAPTAHEDDARRAVKAGLELRTLANDIDILAPVQIGISRGTMRAGAYGGATRRTYGVLGDDVNLAARLMARAAPGEILISGRVHAEVAGAFVVEPRAPIPIKGKAEPLPVFAIAGAQQRRAMRLQEPSYALPMIGRQAELTGIDMLLTRALAGQGQVVGIIAEAGMGKSRLLAEVIRLAWRRGLTSYGGACQSDGITTPYLVWGPIWQAIFDMDPAAPPRRQRRALEAAIDDLARERANALPLLGPLLGITLPENDFTAVLEPQQRQMTLHALLRDCLAAVAREAQADGGGILLVLEDLHWIDAASHDLLEEVAQLIAELPVLIVLAFRPPDLARLQTPRIEALSHYTTIALAELSMDEAAQAIRAKLAQLFPERASGLPEALVARLMAQAQGNPFYLEELLNYLHDRGIDPYAPAALEAIELPGSLHRLVLARIDQLSARQQITLKVASVLGRRFVVSMLHGAYPSLGALDDLHADLDELARIELTPLDTPEPELAYLFKHIVTQEVAYESLAAATRATLHEQVADYLEMRGADQVLDLLAYHYAHSDNRVKARVYLRRAGEAAAARSANDAAVAYLSQALDLVPLEDAAERWELLWAREQVYNLHGARENQAVDLAALEALAVVLKDATRQADVALRWSARQEVMGDYLAAIASAQQALGHAQGDLAREGAARLHWGRALWRHGDFGQARAQLEPALELARATSARRVETEVLRSLGWVTYEQGAYPAARAYHEQALAIARAIGDRYGEAYALNAVGSVAAMLGDYLVARVYFEQSLALCRAIGSRQGEAIALRNLGWVARGQGDYSNARTQFSQALALFRATGIRLGEVDTLGNLGWIAYEQGAYPAACAYHEQSLAIALALQVPQVAESRAGLARALLARGDLSGALSQVGQVLAHLAGGSLDGVEAPMRTYLGCIEVLQAANDTRAGPLLARAYSELHEQAACMDDASQRMFLEQVPDNHTIVVAWQASQSDKDGQPT